MNFIRRRTTLLTREQILGYITGAALDGLHLEALSTPFPQTGDCRAAELASQTHAACTQATRELQVAPQEEGVARGVLAQQVVLNQAVQLLEAKLQRKLTPDERERIIQHLPRILAKSTRRLHGPRIFRDLWGH